MKRVYIADDDPQITNIVRISLGKVDGLEAIFFDNGLDLLRAIQESPPDAIVTDIILPRLEGLAVARLVKFDEQYRHIPLMVISSVIDPDIDAQVRSVGAESFLRKPFRPQEIRERVSALVGLGEPAGA